MAKQTRKAQILNDIHAERRRLEKKLSRLSPEEMLVPGVTGTWSVKDILAHLTAWESLFLDWYSAGLRGATPEISPVGMSRTTIDSLNQRIYEQNQARSLTDVIEGFHASYQEILAAVEEMPEADLFAHGRLAWTGRLSLADYITGNTCNHYAWANSQITRWVKKRTIDRQAPKPKE
jgi:hypothetical protein